MTTRDAARGYIERGWAPIPIPAREKAPHTQGWQHLTLTVADVPTHWNDSQNVGVLLGAPSVGLVDVDLDTPEAAALASAILPPTGAVFGRAGNPNSHRLYVATPLVSTARFQDVEGATLVELRSSGAQTVFPPSVHPSGEVIGWSVDGDAAPVDGRQLHAAVAKLAAAAILARHWPAQGSRDDAALALAGALLRAGWSDDETDNFIVAVARAAYDEEAETRAKARNTRAKLARDEKVRGWPTLAKLIEPRAVEKAREWIGERADDVQAVPPRTWTWADLVQASTAEPPQELVAGLLTSGDRFLIFAFAGVGKSLIGLHLALALQRGEDFLNFFKTNRARVGYLDEESAPARLGQRLRQISAGHDIEDSDTELPLFRVQSGERIGTALGVDRIFEWVRDERIDVLVIDTLRRVLHELKENEADDMAKMEANVKRLQQRATAELQRPLTIVLIHHSPKPRQGASNAPETMARGSSDILAAMDGALYLHRYEGDIKAEHAKARWSEPLEPFLIKIAAGGGTLRMHHAGAAPEKRTEGQRIREFIGAALRASDSGLRRSELLSRCAMAGHKRSQTVTQALSEMVDGGLITREKQGREATYRWHEEKDF